MRGSVIGLVTLPWLMGCSVFGVNTVEEAAYQVQLDDGDFEIRDYQPLVTVETVVDGYWDQAGSVAFRRLFRYISGENTSARKISMTAPVIADQPESGQRIEMTAPVLREGVEGGWRYRFVLPAAISIDTAPRPTDAAVQLTAEPARRVAVVRFSGLLSEHKIKQQTTRLQQWMATRCLSAVSPPRWAGYNPPWTLPFMRRNEVMIALSQGCPG